MNFAPCYFSHNLLHEVSTVSDTKTHVMSCGPIKRGARKLRNRNNKVRIRNSMVFYPKNTKVAAEVPAYQRRLHSKFEENRVKRFRDMSEQTFKFVFFVFLFFSSSFALLKKIAVTRKLVLQSSYF